MNIPNGFKTKISDVFYDKLISVLESSTSVDDEGWGDLVATTEVSTFYGNLRFTGFKEIQEDYGIDTEFDVAITTDEDIELDTILQYDSVTYRVVESLVYDTHNLILAEKWLSKSTT